MSDFKSKFDPQNQGHRFKMLQLIHGLALEINTGTQVKRGASIVKHAKEIGWMPQGIRMKRDALAELVQQARKGMGYVAKDRVLKASRKPSAKPAMAVAPKVAV